jgi:hypothetical protein
MENSRLSPHFWTIITSWKTKISYSFKITYKGFEFFNKSYATAVAMAIMTLQDADIFA